MAKALKVLKFFTGYLELLFALPVVGGFIITSMLWTPLALMLVLHILVLVFSVREGKGILGSIFGIIASVLGWIPILGWALHVLATTFLLIESHGTDKKRPVKEVG